MEVLSPREILETFDELLESLEQNDDCTAACVEMAYLFREELVDSFSSLLDDE